MFISSATVLVAVATDVRSILGNMLEVLNLSSLPGHKHTASVDTGDLC